MILRYLIGLAVIYLSASAASAATLSETMAGTPAKTFTSSRSIDEIERCIVLGDKINPGIVYRTPSRPDESLIYYVKIISLAVIQLSRSAGGVTIRIWNPISSNMPHVEACASNQQ